MLGSTRNIYIKTFAAPSNILLEKALEGQFHQSKEDTALHGNMLLIQPRKRSRATLDHTTSHPASWQSDAKETSANTQKFSVNEARQATSTARENHNILSKTEIAALSLEQLQQLSALVEDRIQIKKRYNNTPLRRIIARQVSGEVVRRPSPPESDTSSQTDTLVNTEVLESTWESPETIQARYNSTPLRRILNRQISGEKRTGVLNSAATTARYEPESLEIRKRRFNNTPLRRIVSRQSSGEPQEDNTATSQVSSQSYVSTPVPRSNTPLRRILSRQTSSYTTLKKEDDEVSSRADSVIDPESPIRSRTTQSTATVHLGSEDELRAYEQVFWGKSNPPSIPRVTLNSEAKIREYEERLWKKSVTSYATKEEQTDRATIIKVTELTAETKKPKRIVVDAKGSPLRRILQRQTSSDWRASARVGVV
jgi:hypothetical protein